MSDAGFKIDVPKGRRAEVIRGAWQVSKARQLARIDERLAQEVDPDTREQLEQLRTRVASETVQKFVMRQLRAAVMIEEQHLKQAELQEQHKQEIREAIRAHLQQFEEI